jgi:hypothetical protein
MEKSKKVLKMDKKSKHERWKKYSKEHRSLLETMEKYTDAVINEDIKLLKELTKH